MPNDCDACPARVLGLFAHAALDARPQLVKYFHLDPLRAKETLYSANEPGEHTYIVRRGLVKLVQYSAGGAERIVRLVRRSECFGMEAVLGQPYRHTAVAISDCDLCQIPASKIREHQRDNPNFAMDLMRSMQDALDKADAFLLELSTGVAQARVARLMLFLSGGASGECPLITREEMGALLGLTTETASRAVAELRRQEVIQVIGAGDYCRCDVTRLRQIAA
jgi:CRP-like cAMP-binding protein